MNAQNNITANEPLNAQQQSIVNVAALTAVGDLAKLKTQFPNLTDGNSEVLDVISIRLSSGSILEGLRLPYIKEPRAQNK